MRAVYLIILTILATSLVAQEKFKEELLNELLAKTINDYRSEHQLPPLERSEILDAAAFDQAKFLQGKNRIQHTQDNKKKETTLDRVMYYGGLHAEVGENIAIVGIGSRQRVHPSGDRIAINTEEQAIAAAIYSWLNDKNSKLNILDEYFYNFGSIVIQSENNLNIVYVFAGEEYQLPINSKDRVRKHSIAVPNAEDCGEIWEKYSTIPQLFSDAFKVVDNEVFFEFHSLPIVESIFSNSGDGIAIDVIYDEQFSCDEGNRVYPGEINDGFLMPIVRKTKMLTSNTLEEEQKVYTSLGKLPSFYNSTNCEINAVIVKGGTKCFTVPYNKYEVLDLRTLDIPYQLIGEELDGSLEWKDTLELSFSIDMGIDEMFNQLKEITEALSYEVDEVLISRQYSPIEKSFRTKEVTELKRKIESSFPDIYFVGIDRKVAWDKYYEFQENSAYAIETEGKDSLEVRKYLIDTAVDDSTLSEFLNGLNTISFKVYGIAKIEEGHSVAEKKNILSHLLSVDKVKQALAIQRSLIEQHQAYETVLEFDISQQTKTLELINNQIIANVLLGGEVFQGNPTHLAFLELYLISKQYPLLNYNRHLSVVKHWGKGNINESIEDWNRSFNNLRGGEEVTSKDLAKTTVNYAMVAANYYYDKGDYSNRKKSFDLLMKSYDAAGFTDKEILELAKYFTYQDQFDRAIKLLLPKVNVERPSEEILFYFLQIAIYEEDLFSKDKYYDLLEKTKELYPNSFCKFFSKEQRGIQALKDNDIKSLYCLACE